MQEILIRMLFGRLFIGLTWLLQEYTDELCFVLTCLLSLQDVVAACEIVNCASVEVQCLVSPK